jgi:integrase
VVFKVMTWNVENLFRPGADAGPTTEPVYEAKLQGLAATINAQAPDALSLQEVGDPAALEDGELVLNPCLGLRLPAARGRRERIANPDEAGKLLAALPPVGRAVWATAFYAGLRLGELRALRWENVDLAEGVIRVEAALDARGSIIAPKSRSGRRTVPIPNALRQVLLDLKRKRSHGYAFGDGKTPFSPSSTYLRARRAWRNAGLAEIGLHEARHTYASILIAAGVNAKAITQYLGHSSIEVTFDLYGHLMPGNEAEAAGLIDGYLERASGERLRAITD